MHYFIAFMFYMNEKLVIVASSILSNTIEEAGDELADAINANLAETRKDTIENFIDKAHEDQIGAKDLATLRDNEAITYLLLNNPTIKGTYLNLIYGNDQGSNMKIGFDFKKSGLTSVFLMYGTARHAPKNQYGAAKKSDAKINPGIAADKNLYNAIYGKAVKAKIGEEQKKILLDAIKKRMEG
jgi:hypothetical protein